MSKVSEMQMDTLQQSAPATIGERTAVVVAAEINSIKEQTKKIVLTSSIEIGRKLCEAKVLVPHGEWGNWLTVMVNYSQSTAENLMKIYRVYGDEQIDLAGNKPKSETFGNLSYSQALLMLALPDEEREDFAQENNVGDMSVSELKEAIRQRDEYRQQAEFYGTSLETAEKTAKQEKEDLKTAAEKEKAALRAAVDKEKAAAKTAADRVKALESQLVTKEKQIKSLAEAAATDHGEDEEEEEERARAEEEIAQLRTELDEAKAAAAKPKLLIDDKAVKLSIYFEDFQADFNKINAILLRIAADNPGNAVTFAGKVNTALDAMKARMAEYKTEEAAQSEDV